MPTTRILMMGEEPPLMMMTRLRIILPAVLIGVVLTVAIAWLCAGWIEVDGSRNLNISNIQGVQEVVVRESWLGQSRINTARFTDLIRDTSGSIQVARWAGDGNESSEIQAGWPMRALRCVNYGEITIYLGSSQMGMRKSGLNPIRGGIELAPRAGTTQWRALPYQPIWLGLIADTLFWSIIACVILWGATGWKRRRRIRRGLCVACGYNLTGAAHEVCPECGRSISAKPQALSAPLLTSGL